MTANTQGKAEATAPVDEPAEAEQELEEEAAAHVSSLSPEPPPLETGQEAGAAQPRGGPMATTQERPGGMPSECLRRPMAPADAPFSIVAG